MVWNLLSGEDFLPDTSLTKLQQLERAETHAKPRMRLLIAIHRKKGKSLDEIVEACAVPRRTVHGTLKRFQERGIQAAKAVKQTGRPKQLNKKQLNDVRKRLLASPHASGFQENFWTTKLILTLVKREYKKTYDQSQMRRLLHELGFSCKKPRQTNYHSSPRECEAFKKKHAEKSPAPDANGAPFFVWTNAHS